MAQLFLFYFFIYHNFLFLAQKKAIWLHVIDFLFFFSSFDFVNYLDAFDKFSKKTNKKDLPIFDNNV